MGSIKTINRIKMVNYFKSKEIEIKDLDSDWLLIDNKYKINKANLYWRNLEDESDKGQGYSILYDRYK